MPFAATVEVERFDEAADWFLKRIVLTGEQASGLTGRAAVDSFWVGAGLQLHQVQSVFDKISKAIESGEPFAEWRAKVRDELRGDAHAETVFRNAVQRAYNAGRWEQMRKDDVVRFRPFWLYDSILDSRTTEVCKICNGTLLPADDPFWSTHVPPLHHRCRSSIRNLRRSEAERRGISKGAPDTSAAKPKGDWGLPPTAPGWKPDLTKVDPKLKPKVEKKAKKREEKPVPPMKATPKPKAEPKEKKPKAPKVPPEHTYEFWLQHYTPKYGAAAKSVAWGRRAMEVGLDMPIHQVAKHVLKLQGTTFDDREFGFGARLEGLARQFLAVHGRLPRTLREVGEGVAEARAVGAMVGHLETIAQRRTPIRHLGKITGTADDQQGFQDMLKSMSLVTGKDLRHPTSYVVDFDYSRSHAELWNKRFLMPTVRGGLPKIKIMAHEWAHPLEFNGDLAKRARDFRAARAKSKVELKTLRELTGDDYDPTELAHAGDFLHPYIGKKYFVSDGMEPTEVTSMAIEQWFSPLGPTDAMRKDPEFAFFGLGQLSGHDLRGHAADSTLDP